MLEFDLGEEKLIMSQKAVGVIPGTARTEFISIQYRYFISGASLSHLIINCHHKTQLSHFRVFQLNVVILYSKNNRIHGFKKE